MTCKQFTNKFQKLRLAAARSCPRFFTTLILGLCTLWASPLQANLSAAMMDELSIDHSLYLQTLSAIKKGHRTNTKQGMAALVDHPLYPYLEKAHLSRQLRQLPYSDVDSFLKRHDGAVVATQLRHEWLSTLARKKLWADFLSYYEPNIISTKLKCWRLEALHETGHDAIAFQATADLWLQGKSQPKSCDSVFKRWQQAGMQSDAQLWERTQLALQNGNMLLARYLSKRASAQLKPYTRRLISVHRDPRRLRRTEHFADQSIYSRDIVSHGLQRLASRDFEKTTELWEKYRGHIEFTPWQYHQIRDKIARQVIASGSEDALPWLIAHDPNAEDSYLLEWRIRLSLRQQHWNQAEHWIALLPAELRAKPRWRYWLARSWQQQNKHERQSQSLMQQLATERHYYGFLAAEAIEDPHGLNHSALPTRAAQNELEDNPAIIRAKHFLVMGELTPARREWQAAIKSFDRQQLIEATALANRWGWHQQAINTTIKADHWNDLDIRFPLAYQDNVIHSAQSNRIRPEWVYAITRQESAFASDAYSSAGARGLMQLRPGTAQKVAKDMGLRYHQRDLFKAEKNILLGSNYLKQLLDTFSGNHILATAAYNAGPHRVQKWLKRQGDAMPYDIWIETLPFHETRNYVQNVLAFSVIYSHRLGQPARLIAPNEMLINTAIKANANSQR